MATRERVKDRGLREEQGMTEREMCFCDMSREPAGGHGLAVGAAAGPGHCEKLFWAFAQVVVGRDEYGWRRQEPRSNVRSTRQCALFPLVCRFQGMRPRRRELPWTLVSIILCCLVRWTRRAVEGSPVGRSRSRREACTPDTLWGKAGYPSVSAQGFLSFVPASRVPACSVGIRAHGRGFGERGDCVTTGLLPWRRRLRSPPRLVNDGAMLHGGEMTQIRANTVKQTREEVYAALQYAASFHCLVEAWRDCEELKPKPKVKWISVDKQGGGQEVSRRLVCGHEQIPLYEMRKELRKEKMCLGNVRAQGGLQRTSTLK